MVFPFCFSRLIKQVQIGACQLRLIIFGPFRVTYEAAQAGSCLITIEEIGIFGQQYGIVTNSLAVIACFLKEQRAIVARQGIVGLCLQHKIEVFNSAIIVAQLRAKQSAIVVGHKVIGH